MSALTIVREVRQRIEDQGWRPGIHSPDERRTLPVSVTDAFTEACYRHPGRDEHVAAGHMLTAATGSFGEAGLLVWEEADGRSADEVLAAVQLAERAASGESVWWPCHACKGRRKQLGRGVLDDCGQCLGTGQRVSPRMWELVSRFHAEIRSITEERDHAVGMFEQLEYEVSDRPVDTVRVAGGRL